MATCFALVCGVIYLGLLTFLARTIYRKTRPTKPKKGDSEQCDNY